MDVHRSRFVPYPVWAITAVAFTRSTDSGYTGSIPTLRLAVGRANGAIEIWNPQRGQWVQETVFAGEKNGIDDLLWTQDPNDTDAEGKPVPGQHRLFSIASSPAVTEWDLATGTPKRRSTGNFSVVWSFAAQPRWRQQKGSTEAARAQDIVAGCGDGTLVLLSTADDDLQFKRVLARVSGKKARCICATYQTRERVVAGFADSMIRVYDTRNGMCLINMSLGESVPGAPKHALVWKVKCLPNGDIVSGDSNGEICIWDGKTYSQLQRLSAHDTDCLDLVTSNDGKAIFSGSLDGKISVFRHGADGRGRNSWAKQSHRRVHHGEVKAVAAFDSKAVSVVVSGGSDVSPRVIPLREYGKEHLRSLPSLPQEPPVTSAPKARLLVSWWDTDIYIWRIARQSVVNTSPEPQKPRKLVARVSLDTRSSIRSVSISPDGRLLAASTGREVKAFQLRRRVETEALAIRKLDVPPDFAQSGARTLALSPDGKWLATVTLENEVYICRVVSDPNKPKQLQILSRAAELDRQHRKISYQSAFKGYDRSINRLAFSSDSSVLVASDLSGYLDSWVLEGHEDATAPLIDIAKHESEEGSVDGSSDSDSSSDEADDDIVIFKGQHWTDNPAGHILPKLDSAPLVLTFRPTSNSRDAQSLPKGNPGVHATRNNPHAHSHELPHGQHKLFVMTAKHQMYELDVLSGKLSDWSRRNPSAVLPDDFKIIRDRVMGCVWDTKGSSERLWLYGSNFVFMLDVGRDLDAGPGTRTTKKRRRKRRSDDDDGADDAQDVVKQRKLESGAGDRVGVHAVAGVASHYENGRKVETDPDRRDRLALPDGEDDGDVAFRLIDAPGADEARDGQRDEERRSWSTFKYRPVLGMVALEDEDEGGEGVLEVALVERPLWDVEKAKS